MNKKIVLIIAVVAIVAVSVGLAFAFVIEPQLRFASVVGTYTNPASGATVQVNNDKTVFVQSEGSSTGVQGTWKFVDDNTIQMSVEVLGTSITTQYNFDGKQLVNTANNGNVLSKDASTINPQTPTETPSQTPAADEEKQSFTLQPNKQYTITLTAKQGYSWDSYIWLNGANTALVSDTQSTLQINNDLTINADFTIGDNGKGTSATITVITANIPSTLNLETNVLNGMATVK